MVADYKKYFSPTAFDDKTRYFLFEETTSIDGLDDMTMKSLRRIEKGTGSTVVIVEYRCNGGNCSPIDSNIVELKDDGVYNKESYSISGQGWAPMTYLESSVVMPWSWEKDREVSYSYQYQKQDFPMVTTKVKRQFTGFETKTLEGLGEVDVAVRKEKQVRSADGAEYRSDIIMWDVPGIGLYRYESRRPGYVYVMEYREEISEAEYNTLLGR